MGDVERGEDADKAVVVSLKGDRNAKVEWSRACQTVS